VKSSVSKYSFLIIIQNYKNDCLRHSSTPDWRVHRHLTSKYHSSKSAGIGGGVIINILLIVGLGYNAKQSVIITYIFLMGGGLASTLASLKKTSQSGKRLMDYNLVMITLPMMMSGAIFGVY
jgi:hypothetical protein